MRFVFFVFQRWNYCQIDEVLNILIYIYIYMCVCVCVCAKKR